MTTMPAERIFQSRFVEVMVRRGTARQALVTFSPATVFADGNSFWGQQIADAGDFTTVSIMGKRPAKWFPGEDMRAAIAAAAPILAGFEQIIGYGSSMGAYGVLKYSRAMRISHAIVFAPQWSIDPAELGRADRRFAHAFDPALHGDVTIRAEDLHGEAVIVFDPFVPEDRLNVDRIAALHPRCALVRSYMTGHFPIETFKGRSTTMSLFRNVLDGDIAAIRRDANQYRRVERRTVRTMRTLEVLIKRNVEVAIGAMERHHSLFNPREKARLHHAIAGRLDQLKRPVPAAAHAERAAALDPDVPDYATRSAFMTLQAGDKDAAVIRIDQAAHRWPGVHAVVLMQVRLLTKAGLYARARELSLKQSRQDRTTSIWSVLLADNAERRRDWAEQQRWLRDAHEIEPNQPSHLVAIGALQMRQGAFEPALETLRKAEQVGENEALHRRRAQILMAQGHDADAVVSAERAVELDPLSANGYSVLVSALEKTGAYARIRAVLEQATLSLPGDATIARLRDQQSRASWLDAVTSQAVAPARSSLITRLRARLRARLLPAAGRTRAPEPIKQRS